MKLATSLLGAIVVATGLAAPASAQIPGGAAAEARTRGVCGTGTVVSAVYLPGGLLQVTCRSNSPRSSTESQSSNAGTQQNLPGALQGTAMTGPAVAGALATVVVLGAVVGGDDSSSTTTTTTNSSSSSSSFLSE